MLTTQAKERSDRMQVLLCDTNCCADMIARKGAEQQLDYCAFSSLPVDVLEIFKKDLDGKYCNRLCADGAVRF